MNGEWRKDHIEVFLSCKTNDRRSVHSPQDHFIITLIISNWHDTRGKWPLARNLERSWWHRHTNKVFFSRSPWLYGQQDHLEEVHNLYHSANIVRIINFIKMKRANHIAWMEGNWKKKRKKKKKTHTGFNIIVSIRISLSRPNASPQNQIRGNINFLGCR